MSEQNLNLPHIHRDDNEPNFSIVVAWPDETLSAFTNETHAAQAVSACHFREVYIASSDINLLPFSHANLLR